MTDFYNLQAFTPIPVGELIDLFKHDQCIKLGGLVIFGDSMGKPGDAIYTLENISLLSSSIIFQFRGNEKIIVHDPLNIYVNEMVIGIDMCKKLEWVWEHSNFQYFFENGVIKKEGPRGSHELKNSDDPAFLFYSW